MPVTSLQNLERGAAFPPLFPAPTELVLRRKPFAPLITVQMPWGESYKFTAEMATQYLDLLGNPQGDKVIDLVWNFHAVWYCPLSQEALIVPAAAAARCWNPVGVADGQAGR